MASYKSRHCFADSDDPGAANLGCSVLATELKVNYVPDAVPIGSSKCGILSCRSPHQRFSEFFSVSGSNP